MAGAGKCALANAFRKRADYRQLVTMQNQSPRRAEKNNQREREQLTVIIHGRQGDSEFREVKEDGAADYSN